MINNFQRAWRGAHDAHVYLIMGWEPNTVVSWKSAHGQSIEADNLKNNNVHHERGLAHSVCDINIIPLSKATF